MRCLAGFLVAFLLMSGPAFAGSTLPAWTMTEQDYMATGMSGKRLTPEGEIDHVLPDDFRGWSDTASAGFGTFQIGVPDAWSAWTIGMGPTAPAIMSIFEERDPDQASAIEEAIRQTFRGPGHNLRGIFAVEDGNDVGFVMVTIRGRLGGQARQLFSEEPELFAKRASQRHYEEIAQIEHTDIMALRAIARFPDASLLAIDYFVVEEANQVLWQVNCIFHEDRADNYHGLCDQIVDTFAPGPFIGPPDR